ARVRTEGTDDRQKLRGRTRVVLLVETGEDDVGVRARPPAKRWSEHHPVVGNMIDIGAGVARAPDRAHGQAVAQRKIDVREYFLAIVAAVNEVHLALRFKAGAFRDKVDETPDRALSEQDRGRTADNFDALEIIGVRGDAGVVGEYVAHSVAELQRVDPAHVEAVDTRIAAIGIGKHARGIFDRVADI